MTRFPYRVYKYISYLSTIGEKISIISVFFMTLSIFYNVFMRYIFNKPTLWAEEINGYMIILVTCFGAAELIKRDAHIKLSVLKIKGKVGIVIESLILLLIILWAAVITYRGFLITYNAFIYDMRESSPLLTPLFIPYSFFAVGCLMIMLQALSMLLKKITNKTEH